MTAPRQDAKIEKYRLYLARAAKRDNESSQVRALIDAQERAVRQQIAEWREKAAKLIIRADVRDDPYDDKAHDLRFEAKEYSARANELESLLSRPAGSRPHIFTRDAVLMEKDGNLSHSPVGPEDLRIGGTLAAGSRREEKTRCTDCPQFPQRCSDCPLDESDVDSAAGSRSDASPEEQHGSVSADGDALGGIGIGDRPVDTQTEPERKRGRGVEGCQQPRLVTTEGGVKHVPDKSESGRCEPDTAGSIPAHCQPSASPEVITEADTLRKELQAAKAETLFERRLRNQEAMAHDDALRAALTSSLGAPPADQARATSKAADAYLRAYLDERDAHANTRKLQEWQPIETAPKDGTHVLLATGYGLNVGVWIPDSLIHRRDVWMIAGGGAIEPTHWMPLPPPPSPQEHP